MYILIDIPEEVYKNIQSKSTEIQAEGYTIENAILNGTPFCSSPYFPKGKNQESEKAMNRKEKK